MTAAEIYEIVKDIPREAWPTGVFIHDDGRWWVQRDPVSAGWPTYPEAVELLFIGSMTRWLVERNWILDKGVENYYAQIGEAKPIGCTCLLRTLAAATRAAAGRGE